MGSLRGEPDPVRALETRSPGSVLSDSPEVAWLLRRLAEAQARAEDLNAQVDVERPIA